MPAATPWSRRSFLVSAGACAATGLAACDDDLRPLQFATLAAAEAELARLAQAGRLASRTAFNWAQTLEHCAQSIEYSMQGFPAPRSALFQATAGAAALRVFAWRGRMTHDLAEPIPGAPALPPQAPAAPALARLRGAVQAFRQWNGPLQPHFAYGALDKAEYEQAHAMHLANHFAAFDVAG